MEWLLSDAVGRFSVANHGDPVDPDLTLTSGRKPMDEVELITLSVAEIAKGVPDVLDQ